jgi:hypothetical protein
MRPPALTERQRQREQQQRRGDEEGVALLAVERDGAGALAAGELADPLGDGVEAEALGLDEHVLAAGRLGELFEALLVDAGHQVVALVVGLVAVGLALVVELLDRLAGLRADADGVDPNAELRGLGGHLGRARAGVLAVGQQDDHLVGLGRRRLAVARALGDRGLVGLARVDQVLERQLERLADRRAARVLGPRVGLVEVQLQDRVSRLTGRPRAAPANTTRPTWSPRRSASSRKRCSSAASRSLRDGYTSLASIDLL